MYWRKYGSAGAYTIWARLDADGKVWYNVTQSDKPPASDGGYYNLQALLRLKEVLR